MPEKQRFAMSITSTHPDDPQPHTPEATPAEQPCAQNGLAWATVGLSAACFTAGVVLSLTGHEETGRALITAGSLGRGVNTRK
jgi:hypothetical protein